MTQPNDASRKSPRTFQCRDQLWETFEQMARELECSVDYLVNESMKQYARQRSYGQPASAPQQPARTPFPSAREQAPIESGRGAAPPPTARAAAPPPLAPPASSARLPPPPPPPPAGGSSARGLPPPPPPPPSRAASGPALPPPGGRSSQLSGPPPIPRGGPSMPPPIPAPAAAAALYALYQGERTQVSKDKFIIGRGRQTSDLTIKDPNVSRQHAMIEFQNNTYFMVDLGSTNGVEFNGQRVTRKAIGEGDVFRICDHEVVFTFRG